MKNLTKITLVFAVFAFTFSQAKPAKAFYLEVPQVLKDIFSSFNVNKTSAQEASTLESQTNFQTPPMGIGEQSQPEKQTRDQGRDMQGGQDDSRQMEQMKRGTKQMERQLKQFELMVASAEKKGIAVSDEIKQKLEKLKGLIETINNASGVEQLQNADTGEIQDIMQSLEDFRHNVMETQQRVEGMKRGMKGMESGIKMFEKQIASLTKKGVAIPTEIQDHITKIKTIIEEVKNAKTSDDLESLDLESMPDLMDSFNQDRQQLEMLARWPQTLKQIDKQLAQLNRELKKSKTIVDRLTAKGIDLQTEYTAFADAINKLKAVRDDAVAKMADGNSEDAFTILEDDFFGQMDDVWQNQKIIMTMSNLGRFASDFKQNMTQVNSLIKNLKKTDIDTTDLEALVSQANDKGQEILDLVKAKPLDADAITNALDELENLKQDFSDKISELTGQDDDLPWEQGPQQFKQVDLPQGFDKFIPQKPTPKAPPLQPTL